jgi:hypothetical protein
MGFPGLAGPESDTLSGHFVGSSRGQLDDQARPPSVRVRTICQMDIWSVTSGYRRPTHSGGSSRGAYSSHGPARRTHRFAVLECVAGWRIDVDVGPAARRPRRCRAALRHRGGRRDSARDHLGAWECPGETVPAPDRSRRDAAQAHRHDGRPRPYRRPPPWLCRRRYRCAGPRRAHHKGRTRSPARGTAGDRRHSRAPITRTTASDG